MSDIGVHLCVDDGITSTQLHDEWLRLFHASNDAARAAGELWQEWKNATANDRTESPETRRLWAEYSAFQSDYRVLTAWRDAVHSAWVFSTDGRKCRFVTQALVSIS